MPSGSGRIALFRIRQLEGIVIYEALDRSNGNSCKNLVVCHIKERLLANLADPRPGFLMPLEPSEHTLHEQMLKIAYSHYDSILNNGKLVPFAGECQLREGGRV
jgi:hypothetical protein